MSDLSRMATLLASDEPVHYVVTSYRAGADGLLAEAETAPCPDQAKALAEAEAAAKRHAMAIVFRETEDGMGVRRASVLKVFGEPPTPPK